MFYVQRQRKGDGSWQTVAARSTHEEASSFAQNHPSLQSSNTRVVYIERPSQTKEDIRAGRY